MADELQLHHPWLVAVWPGMGHVALNAGIYLLAKLGMKLIAEFEAADLFDVDHVEVKDGLIQPGRRPRNRLFVWTDPNKKHDLVVFLGEAQPPLGKFAFCRQLITMPVSWESSASSPLPPWPRRCTPNTARGSSARPRTGTAWRS